jgi:hypothetical protein
MKTKRIKHAFSSPDIVTGLWAKQTQFRAHCRKQCFFEGPDIYSYGKHYLLGRLTTYNGKKIALVNFNHYSKTTSGHSISAFYSAENSGILAIETQGDFSPSAVLVYLKQKQDALLNDLGNFQAFGYRYHSRFIFQDLKAFNKMIAALGHNELRILVPKQYIKYCDYVHATIKKAQKEKSLVCQTLFKSEDFPVLPWRSRRNYNRKNNIEIEIVMIFSC